MKRLKETRGTTFTGKEQHLDRRFQPTDEIYSRQLQRRRKAFTAPISAALVSQFRMNKNTEFQLINHRPQNNNN